MLELFAHPFSSYCQKALTALYENDTPFRLRMLSPENPDNFAELLGHWPFGKFPVLVDDGRPVIEASVIVEYLDVHHPGPARLVPADPEAALKVRFWDRFFDNYVATPQNKFVDDALRPADSRDPLGVERAGAMLDKAYGYLERHMAGRQWAVGENFSLADCAAAPQLFYADWTHPIGDRFPAVTAYRERLNARASFARCIEAARPYRPLFPLGAPDRD
ncbi:glutathione S-transferase family protein [Jiella endophytica]|uniref:Glutathione S-transferase family protein n=1 Tax=Jiella endophytica TaxID=2558362 RepID=A0A4Y8R9S2_9HYPH|nr:glutathione S-transferase family protein [Jiella endophytica]TFF18357.1 glutathione S-transferase family protein [Jiella endophytica]